MRPPEDWKRARVTLVIAGITAAAWALAAGLGISDLAGLWAGFIPARFGGIAGDEVLAPFALTPLTATLAHGGLMHLVFNLAIFLFCGRAVENIVGGRQLAILYVIGAYAAAAFHYLADPASNAPAIGASGAISAVIGSYALLFGRNRVKVADPRLALWLHVLWLAAAWVGLQILVGLMFQKTGMLIAVAAHIGGFLAGLALARPLLLLKWRGA
jgi:membrane associated rhomboid family serine protease